MNLRYETEGSRFTFKLDIKSGKATQLKKEQISE